MIATEPHIVVKAPGTSKLEDTEQYGSLTLYREVFEHNWTHVSRTSLEVVAVPPGELYVRPGDMLHVNFNAVFDELRTFLHGSDLHFKVRYGGAHHSGDVYAYERDGELHAIFDWVLVEPKKLDPLKSDLLLPDQAEKFSENIGIVRYLPPGEHPFNVGDTVVFHEHDSFLNTFGSHGKFYTMKSGRINAVIDEA